MWQQSYELRAVLSLSNPRISMSDLISGSDRWPLQNKRQSGVRIKIQSICAGEIQRQKNHQHMTKNGRPGTPQSLCWQLEPTLAQITTSPPVSESSNGAESTTCPLAGQCKIEAVRKAQIQYNIRAAPCSYAEIADAPLHRASGRSKWRSRVEESICSLFSRTGPFLAGRTRCSRGPRRRRRRRRWAAP